MTKLTVLTAYFVYALFVTRFLWHAMVWWKGLRHHDLYAGTAPASRFRIVAATTADVFFLTRLFRVNAVLWFGEWLFHVSFLLVLLRHLRYLLDPVPGWVWSLQPPGVFAGYVLPLSLLYILGVRLLTRREKYTSPLNVIILALLFLISLAGILMHGIFKPDLAGIKAFMTGILSFSPAPLPGDPLFVIHLFLVFILVPFLPSHIFAALMVISDARKREAALKKIMHD